MLFRLVRPMKREGSNNRQFVQRIPADLKARAVGLTLRIPVGPDVVTRQITTSTEAIRLSLRTADPSEVKVRQAQIAAYLENVWRSLRQVTPVTLDQRQATALAKDFYDGWANGGVNSRDLAIELQPDGSWAPGDPLDVDSEPDAWESVRDALDRPDPLGRQPEEFLKPLVRDWLRARGVGAIDEGSMERVVRAVRKALDDAFANRKRQAEGDFRPDPNAGRFPNWTPPNQPPLPAKPTSTTQSGEVSMNGLVDSWWAEAKAAGRTISTYESYASAMAKFAEFLEHDDAALVTQADVLAFKNHRLAQGISPKTVGDSDIAALRRLFGWAVTNKKLPSNPAAEVKVMRQKPSRKRSKGFTDAEAEAILAHSLHHHRHGREAEKLVAAKRWAPWLCAYTGARIGEVVQLRKQDVAKEGDNWVMTITPEANTVKDKEVRQVVLHAHLVEQGFGAFVEKAPPGYLFLTLPKDGDVRKPWRTTKNRLREFAREVVKDPDVAPNHGWRHLFNTIGREAGISDTVLDAITGHAPRTIGDSYGEVSLRAKADAMARFPRFEMA